MPSDTLPKSIQALKARKQPKAPSPAATPKPSSAAPRLASIPWLEFAVVAAVSALVVVLLQVWGLIPSPTLGFINRIAASIPQVRRGEWMPPNFSVYHLPWLFPLLAGLVGGFLGREFIFGNSTPGNARKKGSYTCKLGGLTWDRNSFCRGWLITGATGTGKALRHDTPIRYRDSDGNVATKPVSHVRPGDLLFTHGGAPATVLGVYPQGRKKLVQITVAGGHTVVCCLEHQWAIRILGTPPLFRVVDTAELLNRFRDGAVDMLPRLAPEAPDATSWHNILTIEDAGEDMAVCLAVDAPSRLFALGNGLLTHNTQVGINVLMHQLFQNECGTLDEGWSGSSLAATAERYAAKFLADTKPVYDELKQIADQIADIDGKLHLARQATINAQLRKELGDDADLDSPTRQQKELERQLDAARLKYEQTEDSIRIPRENYSRRMFEIERLKFSEAPWGGVCMDEKGLYWQTLSGMARHYGRDHHLCLLQTRPEWAGPNWKPVTRFNLLSDYSIPANTYADAIVETATSLAGGEGDKGFFKTQAQTQIGKAIELCRAIRTAQLASGVAKDTATAPNLKLIYDLLKSQADYNEFLVAVGALGKPNEIAEVDRKGQPVSFIDANGEPTDQAYGPPSLVSPQITELLGHFQKNYWAQPKDQLGGVIGTLQNYLAYFQTPEIAEVFCSDNTFDLDDIERGKIMCVAMPQKFSIERRYVCTILKILSYKLILRRFDKDKKTFDKKNLIVIWQDEVQRFIIREDGNVDVIREAGGTTVMACQSKASLYPPLGGKEKANVTILNLRNRLILRAADDDCAQGSAEFMGKAEREKMSRSTSKQGTSYSYSPEEQFIIKPHEFRNIPDFCAVVYHASGMWRTYCIQPYQPDGATPIWWFGGRPVKGRDPKTGRPTYGRAIAPKAPFGVRIRHKLGFRTDCVHFTIPKARGR